MPFQMTASQCETHSATVFSRHTETHETEHKGLCITDKKVEAYDEICRAMEGAWEKEEEAEERLIEEESVTKEEGADEEDDPFEEDSCDGRVCLFHQEHERNPFAAVVRQLSKGSLSRTEEIFREKVFHGKLSPIRSESPAKYDETDEGSKLNGLKKLFRCITRLRSNEYDNEETNPEADKMAAIEQYINPQPIPSKQISSAETVYCEISEVFVSDPDAEEGKQYVSFGMSLATLEEEKYTLHVCIDVAPGNLADQFGFKDRDELMMVNSEGVINKPREDVLKMFADLQTAEPITFITRRYLDETEEYNDDTKVKFIRTIGEITIDEEESNGQPVVRITESCNYVTRASFTGPLFKSRRTVRANRISPEGFLKLDGQTLSFKKGQADEHDDSYKFDVLNCFNTGTGELFDVIESFGHKNFFLTVNDDDSVTMEEREVRKGKYDKGVPVDLKGVAFKPKGTICQQKYHVLGDENKYLAWDEENGIHVEEFKNTTNAKSKYLLQLFDVDASGMCGN